MVNGFMEQLDMFEPTDDPDTIEALTDICERLNDFRARYQAAKAIKDTAEMRRVKRCAKMILPESFLQKRTICTNYAELRHMYAQRHNHELPEWNTVFVNWIKSLPYSELITEDFNASH